MTDYFGDILKRRMKRRSFLKGTASVLSALAVSSPVNVFAEAVGTVFLQRSLTEKLQIAKGYLSTVIAKWGDSLFPNQPDIDFYKQDMAKQEKQFGYNNDFIAYMPIPYGSENSQNGLLCVNHEYTNASMMFPNPRPTMENVQTELMAHGHSVMEVVQIDGKWQVATDSPYNRRITGFTKMKISGPAKDSKRLSTSYDPHNEAIIGTLNNCSGGKTPWGSVLICEENFDKYFNGDISDIKEEQNYKRYGIGGRSSYDFHKFIDRFNIEKELNEANRFGWIIELDPYNPDSVPVKHTALGRFKHETATTVLAADGRIVVYTGDDEKFEYIYKFVSKGKYNPAEREANFSLLGEGTLYVAKFIESDKLRWLPLVYGKNGLTKENGFESQADVLIETRRAADIVGATRMDRPEGIAVSPQAFLTFVVMSNNPDRTRTNLANPRENNIHGHIIRLVPPMVDDMIPDHGAEEFFWNIFLLADGQNLSCPDNITFDDLDRMWVATDGQMNTLKKSESLYVIETIPQTGVLKNFVNAPRGAEICSPEFTPDRTTMFLSIQHPGDEPGASFSKPTTRWPDFKNDIPARPAVIAITKDGGGPIG